MPFQPRLRGLDAQRVLVIGKAGSGKTTLAAMIARAVRPVIYFDPKALNDPGWEVVTTVSELLGKGGEWIQAGAQIIVQPDVDGTSDQEQLERIARAVFRRGNMLLVIDDALGVMGTKPPYWVNRCITMGRGRGIGFMAITQRAHNVPLILLTEAEHIIAFELHGKSDVDRLVVECDQTMEQAASLRRWWFYWYDREERTGQLCQPLNVGRRRPPRASVAPAGQDEVGSPTDEPESEPAIQPA